MSYLATYSCRDVVITYAGMQLSSGKGEDAFMTMEYNSDRITTTTGCSGDTAVSISPDQSGTITLTYQSTSNSAKLLNAFHGGLRAAGNVLGDAPMGVVDPSGSTLIVAAEVALQSVGTNTLGIGENTRDFVFHVQNMVETALPEDLASSLGEIGQTLPIVTK